MLCFTLLTYFDQLRTNVFQSTTKKQETEF